MKTHTHTQTYIYSKKQNLFRYDKTTDINQEYHLSYKLFKNYVKVNENYAEIKVHTDFQYQKTSFLMLEQHQDL